MSKYAKDTSLLQYNNNLFKDYIEPTDMSQVKSNVKQKMLKIKSVV